jgi:hypothetical protein
VVVAAEAPQVVDLGAAVVLKRHDVIDLEELVAEVVALLARKGRGDPRRPWDRREKVPEWVPALS